MKDNIIEVDIEDHFGGEYRLYYDGKYLGLMGTDKNYLGFNYNPNDPIWYEEMVLIPVIIEIRNVKKEFGK